jgi:Fungal Zn(2)-Cys(6) binuclear cluster domain
MFSFPSLSPKMTSTFDHQQAPQQSSPVEQHSPITTGSVEQEEWSGDDVSDHDGSGDGDGQSGPRNKRRKLTTSRPLSVSCEKCKERKVKCDRGQPSCGWCLRNNKLCEYKERKKPGLRAGYGRELEARLGKKLGELIRLSAH